MVLPADPGTKLGLDDFLVREGAAELSHLIDDTMAQRLAFPRMPDVRGWVNKKLQRGKMTRRECQEVALTILLEMDAEGQRMYVPASNRFHFFDERSYTLLPVDILGRNSAPQHETPFGVFLYRRFGLSPNDKRIMEWLATLFTGEPGVIEAKTYKVITVMPDNPDEIAIQLGDSRFAVVSGSKNHPVRIYNNGSRGILFEQGQVDKVNTTVLMEAVRQQLAQKLDFVWYDIIDSMNFVAREADGDVQESKLLAALLFYISPWLNRWRGTQMPVELIIGEAGSGKSSLYGLRQRIITGSTRLVNLSTDIRDWYSSIASVGGLHISDNVHFTSSAKDVRQRLSDEICRMVTEPDPHVELRQLYTTSQVVKLPIQATFAITAIQQPFRNTDFIQRSAIFELRAIGDGHDAGWTRRHLEHFSTEYAREHWLAHHMVFIHKFLAAASHTWDDNYASSHRLINYEQALRIAANIFGHESDWIPKALTSSLTDQLSDADWALQGLEQFVKDMMQRYPASYHNKRFTTKDITQWAAMSDRFSGNTQLTNAWSLSKYLKTHAKMVRDSAMLYEGPPVGNRKAYRIQRHVNLEDEYGESE